MIDSRCPERVSREEWRVEEESERQEEGCCGCWQTTNPRQPKIRQVLPRSCKVFSTGHRRGRSKKTIISL